MDHVILALTLLILGTFPRFVGAFPEMVRHGYNSCIACHFSPSGGGILTAYGRVQADQLLSMNPTNTLSEDKPISFSAQFRALQLQSETEKSFRQQFILMQSDMEAAISYGQITTVGTLGTDRVGAFSRRHYAVLKISNLVSVRGGRFLPFSGLGLPDHSLAVKRGLGPGEEKYALELSFRYNGASSFLSCWRGGGAFRQALSIDNSTLGVGVRSEGNDLYGGPFFSARLGSMFWFDFDAVIGGRDLDAYSRINFEPAKGAILYASGQTSKREKDFIGLGARVFPITGTEFQGELNFWRGGYTTWFMANLWL